MTFICGGGRKAPTDSGFWPEKADIEKFGSFEEFVA